MKFQKCFLSGINMWSGLLLQFEWLDILSFCNLNTFTKQNRINTIFWCCLFFAFANHYYNKLLRPHLKTARFAHHKWDVTIRYTWNCCFYIVATVFLFIYQKYILADNWYFKKNGQNYQRSYENLLFHTSNAKCSLFNSINSILISFYLNDLIKDLNERNISDGVNKFLAGCIVICFDVNRLEYFSINFNILLCLIYSFNDGLRLICWHISEKNDFSFRICVTIKLLLWSFVFLNYVPFNFLIPTLYGRKFHFWLNVFLWIWYGACVWNSPFLQYMYHQIYHVSNHSNECLSGKSVSRCILLKETNELRHLRNIQKALDEIQYSEQEHDIEKSSNAKTYQTIKCMMALKRKLKRIRENKENTTYKD